MFSVDANRCPTCPAKDRCTDRKKIIPALSALAHELNTNPEFENSPGDGLIIFACQARPTE